MLAVTFKTTPQMQTHAEIPATASAANPPATYIPESGGEDYSVISTPVAFYRQPWFIPAAIGGGLLVALLVLRLKPGSASGGSYVADDSDYDDSDD